jgi:uncharacterized protein YndB with AHSA1/START domain
MARPKHVFETYIKATPERIWEALTEPEFTRRYYFANTANSTWEKGAPYSLAEPDGTVAMAGEVLEVEPARRLVLSLQLLYDADAAAEPASKVTWEITRLGDVCRLTCIHGDLAFSPKTWLLTADRWNVILNGLKTLLETGEPLGEIPDDGASPFGSTEDADKQWHRSLGIDCNNNTYELLGRADRTPDETETMVHMAHAANYHWGFVGTVVNRVRGEYLCSRVYSFVGRAEPALHHAEVAMRLAIEANLDDFDLVYAHEGMARALACMGRLDEARNHLEQARSIDVADPEDKAIVDDDLAVGPWYGLTG